MVSLSTMKAKTKIVPVEWDDETVEVSYFVNAVTPALLEEVTAAAEKEDISIVAAMLEPVLDWWDVTEEDGGPRLPTTKENIRIIPLSFLNRVQAAITEDQNPPEESSSGAS